jgi:general secretion pathway protein A
MPFGPNSPGAYIIVVEEPFEIKTVNMYLDTFKLTTFPFQVTPDETFLFLSKAHARAKAYLDYAVWSPDGFVVITGEVGCGKTILIKKMLAELPKSVVVAQVFQTQVNETEFLQMLLAQLGIKAFQAKKVELLDTLNGILLSYHQQKRQVILVVDEAQNLDERVLEEIRLLSGLTVQNEKILNVILAGQSELSRKLDSASLEQLAQRVQLRFHIKPLSESETKEYIEHRLTVAGAGGRQIFPADTIPLIYRYTGGVPRLINVLCDTVLTAAFVENIPVVSINLVNLAIEELQWVPHAERMHQLDKEPTADNAHPLQGIEANLAAGNGSAETAVLADRVNKLYEFVPKFATNVSGRLKNIDEQLKGLTELVKRKKQ